MFCNKCGSEIVEDSIYCSFCGVKIVPEVPNWDEREQASSAARRQSVMNDGGIRPSSPRKICKGCKKELPASTEEDYCAICTMKNTHAQEEAENRKIEQQKRKQEAHRQEQNRQAPQKARQVTSYYSEKKSEASQKTGMNGCLIAVLAVVGVVVLLGIIGAVIGFFSYQTMSSADMEEYATSSYSSYTSSDDWQEEVNSILADFDMYSSSSIGEGVPEISSEPFFTSVEELYENEVLNLAQQVAGLLPCDEGTGVETWFDRETLSADGGYIYLSGTIARTFQGVNMEQQVLVGLVTSDDAAMQLYLSTDGDVIIDNREVIARDGSFNPDLEWEVFGWDTEDYGPYFALPVYQPAEMEGSEMLAPLPLEVAM